MIFYGTDNQDKDLLPSRIEREKRIIKREKWINELNQQFRRNVYFYLKYSFLDDLAGISTGAIA